MKRGVGSMYLYGIAYLHFDTMAWAFLLPDQFTDTRWMRSGHPKPIRLIEIINIDYTTIFFSTCTREIELFVHVFKMPENVVNTESSQSEHMA